MVTIRTYEDLAHVLQYIEETDKGTTPTIGTGIQTGQEQIISCDLDMSPIITLQGGSRDPYKIQKGIAMPGLRVDYVMQNTSFLQKCINTADEDKTYSFHMKENLGATPTARNWLWDYGKLARAGWGMNVGAETRAFCDIIAHKPADTDPSFTDSSDPATTPVTSLTPGSDPITINGVNPEILSFSVMENNDLKVALSLGESEFVDVVVGGRSFVGSFTIYKEGKTFWDLVSNFTDHTIVCNIDNVVTGTMSNCNLVRGNNPFSPVAELIETYTFTGLTINLA